MKRNDDLFPARPGFRAARDGLSLEHDVVEDGISYTKIAGSAVRSRHVDAKVNQALSPPNGTFEHASKDILVFPPDCWFPGSGSAWGSSAQLYHDTDDNGGRAVVLRAVGSVICTIQSEVFAVTPSTDYNLDLSYYPTGSGTANLNIVVEFWKDAAAANASAILASRTHVAGTGVKDVWQLAQFRAFSIPSDANFMRVRMEKSAVDSAIAIKVGKIFVVRWDIDQPSFTGVIFSGTWANYGGSYFNIGHMKDSMGFVHLRGIAKDGTIGTTIFQLPSDRRPASDCQFIVWSGGAAGLVIVQSGGNVVASAGVNTDVPLDGITFYAG